MSVLSMSKRAASLAVASAITVAATPLAASAATASGPASTHRPQTTVICYSSAVTPFQIVNGGSTYGRALMTGCTNPPQECKEIATLEEQTGVLGGWVPVATSNPGWTTNCETALQVTATYKCQGIIAKRNFRTEAINSIMYEGQSSSSTTYSSVASLYCD